MPVRGDFIPPVSDYAHWNEEAESMWYAENRYDMEHWDEPVEVDDFELEARNYNRMVEKVKGRTRLADEAKLEAEIERIREARKKWPAPTEEEPSESDLFSWFEDDQFFATDGCEIEPDGTCEHGHPSWLLRLGMI